MGSAVDGAVPRPLVLVWRVFWLVVKSLALSFYKNVFPYSWQKRKSIKGQIVLVTGAGGGIGRELSAQLAAEGSRLVLWDLNPAANEETAKVCRERGVEVHCQTVDISSAEAIYHAADECRRDFGEPDIVINNAGVLNNRHFFDLEDDKMSRLVDINVKSLFWTTKAFVPKMIERGSGHVVTLASMSSLFGAPNLIDYSASKHAAYGFMEGLGHYFLTDHPKSRLTTTTICPYYVKTPMIGELMIEDDRFDLLEIPDVARRTVQAIRMETRVLVIPPCMALLWITRLLYPWNLAQSVMFNRLIETHT